LANRRIDPERDSPPFERGGRVDADSESFVLDLIDGEPSMRVRQAGNSTEGGGSETHEFVGVIGEEPLRQYLAPFPDGRLQVATASWDVREGRWFDVFEGDDREPGDWGHWTGQGMNWNANCAYCHMTEYNKNLDSREFTYKSEWTAQGIQCAQCHGNLKEHVRSARSSGEIALPDRLQPAKVRASCASCHSRREQLTADDFEPGDAYHQHFGLSLPTRPGLYHADGQIRDEVFVEGSFRMSRMAHAGVRCLDCHNPHSTETIIAANNNQLCLRCHSAGIRGAPVIEPTEHSHHPAKSAGNRCVACHMPKTKYMQIDGRRDHGFHAPDPRLTRELGIPNACNRCHQSEGVDWQMKHAERWYGDALADSRQRERARAIHGMWNGKEAAADKLLELAEDEPIPFWRATYAGLLAQAGRTPEIRSFLQEALQDASPLVRAAAIPGLRAFSDRSERLNQALKDPSRLVRISAARLAEERGELPSGQAAEDWRAYLGFNADRPQTLLIRASRAFERDNTDAGVRRLERAIGLEPANAEIHRQAATLYSGAGMNDRAEEALRAGWERAPDDARFPFSIGLLRAEQGRLQKAVNYLREAVALDPGFHRAWYNLALALTKQERWQEARDAIRRAEPGMSNDPGWQRTQAIIERRLGRGRSPGDGASSN